MWVKYITRRLAVQVAQEWNSGFGMAMKKVYGVHILNTLVFRDSHKTEYYVDKKQFEIYVSGLYGLLKNIKFLKSFHKKAQFDLEKIYYSIHKELAIDLEGLSNDKILQLYRDFIVPNMTQFYIRMWTVFNIADPLADVVRQNLLKCVPAKKVDDYLLSLSSPLVPNDVIKERTDLLKIAILKNKDKTRYIKQHAKKYQHIPMFDFDHEPYTVEYFTRELKKIKKPSQELRDITKQFAHRQSEFKKIIRVIKPNEYLTWLLRFLKENVFLRDYRDMIRQKINLELRKFYVVVGQRLGLAVDEVAILTNQEIINYLGAGKKFPKAEIKRRQKCYLLIQKTDKVVIYSGQAAINRFKKETGFSKQKKQKNIVGVAASRGLVRGKVKIVFTNRDLYKVSKGDILVATMTRQDFVPAMRRASAIVTDEGAVTCHAAIIAREMNKPCIVGTKFATKIFKDGDLVEVDANRGIVKKLK